MSKELCLCDTCEVRIYGDKIPGCNVSSLSLGLSPYGKVVACGRYVESQFNEANFSEPGDEFTKIKNPISPHDAYEKSQRVVQDLMPDSEVRHYAETIKLLDEAIEKMNLIKEKLSEG